MTSIALLRRVRNQRKLPRAHDGGAELPLVLGAGARDPTRQDLRTLRDERKKEFGVLVVDVVDLVRAELADLAATEHRTALPVLAGRAGRACRAGAPAPAAAATTAAATAAAESSLAGHR